MVNPKISFLMLTQKTNKFTLGKLYKRVAGVKDEFLSYTLECPWLNNQPFVSCIPAGDYVIRPCVSPRFGRAYYIESEQGDIVGYDKGIRTHCLFHSANNASELQGCVALGESVGVLHNEFAVLNSKKSIKHFYDLLDGFDYRLQVVRR